MTTRRDAVQGAHEVARVTALTVVQLFAEGAIEIGASAPVVAPLCTALLKAKGVVDAASRNKEELAELQKSCEQVTAQVIVKAEASKTSTIDVSPLQQCVDKLAEMAERYHDQGRFARRIHFRKIGEDIQKLRARIEAVVPIMGLSAGMSALEKLDRILARLQLRPKLAPVPKNVPTPKSWHAVPDGVVGRVVEILGRDGGPALAALTGRSGAGKTTAAASMVNKRGLIHPRPGETEDDARTRLEGVRALFPDGVMWLRVGRKEGAADRLPFLMLSLAKALYEDVMEKRVEAPAAGERGESYVKKIVSQESLRCLVVADDVWHAEVVEKLRETGTWVLLTTRNASIVAPKEKVLVDELRQEEAEDVLRCAAGLPRNGRLCDAAVDLLDICGHVAMDIAFVGRWDCVRTADGEPKSRKAWEDVLRDITTQIDRARDQARDEDAAGMEDLSLNRLAVLRAGFEYIVAENILAQKLFVMLAVLPRGYSFGGSDAAVLLNIDEQLAMDTIVVLERWAVLRADTSGLYRIHDAHVNFARVELKGSGKNRDLAIQRWTTHISRLDVAIGFDVYAVLDTWRALEEVGGGGWWVTRPYDDQLVEMGILDPSKSHAVNFVAELFDHDQHYVELEALMQRVLTLCEANERDRPEVQMAALHRTLQSLTSQGRYQECEHFERRLGEMIGPGFQTQELDWGTVCAQQSMCTTFHVRGICAVAAKRWKDAEELFTKALKVEEDGGRSASSQAASTLHELGKCARWTGRPGEAIALLRRALEIKEAQLGPDHVNVAWTLQNMGQCARKIGRLIDAEALFRRALQIQEAKLGADDVGVAYTLALLALSVREAGRPGDAVPLFQRALEIEEAKLGANDVGVASTLCAIALCVWETRGPGNAVSLFQRALEIMEAKLGADDVQATVTRSMLARCVEEGGGPAKTE